MIEQLWNRLTAERQRQVRSWSYSATLNISVLMVLAMCTIHLPSKEPLELTFTMGSFDDLAEDSITIAPVIDSIPEPPTVEPPPFEPVPLPEPEIPELPIADLELSDQGDIAAGEPDAEPSSSSDGSPSDADVASETLRRVAAAGGATDVPVAVSLSFSGVDDLDLHVQFQGSHKQKNYRGKARGNIWFRYPKSRFGRLDVDANARNIARHPCENIAFAFPPQQAKYKVMLHHYKLRSRKRSTPYIIVVKYGHKTDVYRGAIRPGEMLNICEFQYRHRNHYRLGPTGHFHSLASN